MKSEYTVTNHLRGLVLATRGFVKASMSDDVVSPNMVMNGLRAAVSNAPRPRHLSQIMMNQTIEDPMVRSNDVKNSLRDAAAEIASGPGGSDSFKSLMRDISQKPVNRASLLQGLLDAVTHGKDSRLAQALVGAPLPEPNVRGNALMKAMRASATNAGLLESPDDDMGKRSSARTLGIVNGALDAARRLSKTTAIQKLAGLPSGGNTMAMPGAQQHQSPVKPPQPLSTRPASQPLSAQPAPSIQTGTPSAPAVGARTPVQPAPAQPAPIQPAATKAPAAAPGPQPETSLQRMSRVLWFGGGPSVRKNDIRSNMRKHLNTSSGGYHPLLKHMTRQSAGLSGRGDPNHGLTERGIRNREASKQRQAQMQAETERIKVEMHEERMKELERMKAGLGIATPKPAADTDVDIEAIFKGRPDLLKSYLELREKRPA